MAGSTRSSVRGEVAFPPAQSSSVGIGRRLVRAVLFLLDAQDVGGAAVGGEQVGAVIGAEQGGDGVGAGEQADEIVVQPGAEHGGENVVAGALGAKLDAQAFGEEFQHFLDDSSAPAPDRDMRVQARMLDQPHRSDRRRPFSRMMRMMPSAARRSAYGSPDPVGFSSMAKNAASRSSLSASATATDTAPRAPRRAGPRGA